MDLLFLGGLKQIFDLLSHVVKSRCLTIYLKAMERFRGFFIRGLMACLCLMLATAGFLIIHIGLFLYLPGELETKALIFLILGIVYFIVPLVVVCCLYSRSQWMKVSGAEEIIERLSQKKKS